MTQVSSSSIKSRALIYEEGLKKRQMKNMGIKQKARAFEEKSEKILKRRSEDFKQCESINSDKQNCSALESSSMKREMDSKELLKAERKGLPSPYECAERLKERIHFINYNESLYYFNGKCYDRVSVDDVIKLYRAKVDEAMGYERNLNIFNHITKALSTDSKIVVRRFENNKRIAVLRNGIYDVMYEELRPHTHKEIVFSYIDADYVEGEECVYFDRFVYDVTEGDEILQERLWMSIGYILLQTLEAKVFFVMGEAPDSGKSLLGNFIEKLFPEAYVSNIALTDMNKAFSVAPIAGSAINISLDLPSTRLNAGAVSKLKMLTGGDSFNINQKYEKEFRYENRAKLLFASNFPIELIEEDNAFWNRLVYLPFNVSIPKSEQDKNLLKKFQKEKNAIVSKALYYAKQLIEADFEFPTTKEIESKMQIWRGMRCTTIENFIQDCCDCNAEYHGELMQNLYLAYERYCDNIGYVAKSRPMFKKILQEKIGLKHFKMRSEGDNPQSAFKGIKILYEV